MLLVDIKELRVETHRIRTHFKTIGKLWHFNVGLIACCSSLRSYAHFSILALDSVSSLIRHVILSTTVEAVTCSFIERGI